MAPFDIDAFLTFFIQGMFGILLLIAFFVPSRHKSELEMLREENEALIRKKNHYYKQYRIQAGEISSLSETLDRERSSHKKTQLSRERLNGELVRRGSHIRSLELALQEERSKAKGRR